MNDTTILRQLSLPQKALVFDLEALYPRVVQRAKLK